MGLDSKKERDSSSWKTQRIVFSIDGSIKKSSVLHLHDHNGRIDSQPCQVCGSGRRNIKFKTHPHPSPRALTGWLGWHVIRWRSRDGQDGGQEDQQYNPPISCQTCWVWRSSSYHRLCPVMTLVRASVRHCRRLRLSDNQAETCLIMTINDTSIGDLPLIITISDTSKAILKGWHEVAFWSPWLSHY